MVRAMPSLTKDVRASTAGTSLNRADTNRVRARRLRFRSSMVAWGWLGRGGAWKRGWETEVRQHHALLHRGVTGEQEVPESLYQKSQQ